MLTLDELQYLDGLITDPPLLAITHVQGPPLAASLSNPHLFVCSDHHSYWTKRRSQRGLGIELIAARLAHLVGVGPIAHPVMVTDEALPADGSAGHCVGLCAGFLNVPDTVNTKELQQFLAAGGTFDPASLNAAGRTRVVTFRTWIGAGDAQALLQPKTGGLLSIDHGDALDVSVATATVQMVTIPGVADDLGRDIALASPTLDQIEALSDRALLEAVACVPEAADWGLDAPSRLQIAEWLAGRRATIREVMALWAT